MIDVIPVRALCTENSVTLFWEKPAGTDGARLHYRVYIDGVKAGETDRTHFTIEKLAPDTAYTVTLRAAAGDRESLCAALSLRTGPAKRLLDVTRPPYCAKGDGRTLNTARLQQAIDDCTPGDAVYLPAGCFLTGALRLHGNMELRISEGAVLQGTACDT